MQAATVSIDESFLVDSPPEDAWRLLTDPGVVVQCMPGAEVTEERGDGTLVGALRIKLGPTVVAFKGEVTPKFDELERQGSLVAQGVDAQGRTRARATTNFTVTTSDGTGATVSLTGLIEVSGALAPFVRTGGAHLARRMVADFSSNLSAHIDARSWTQRGAAAPPPATAPVSAFRLLLGAMADMLRSGAARFSAFTRRLVLRKGRR